MLTRLNRRHHAAHEFAPHAIFSAAPCLTELLDLLAAAPKLFPQIQILFDLF